MKNLFNFLVLTISLVSFSAKAAELSDYGKALATVKNLELQDSQRVEPTDKALAFKTRWVDGLRDRAKIIFYLWLVLSIEKAKLELTTKLTPELKKKIAGRFNWLDSEAEWHGCVGSCGQLSDFFSQNQNNKFFLEEFALKLKKLIEEELLIQSKL